MTTSGLSLGATEGCFVGGGPRLGDAAVVVGRTRFVVGAKEEEGGGAVV